MEKKQYTWNGFLNQELGEVIERIAVVGTWGTHYETSTVQN